MALVKHCPAKEENKSSSSWRKEKKCLTHIVVVKVKLMFVQMGCEILICKVLE